MFDTPTIGSCSSHHSHRVLFGRENEFVAESVSRLIPQGCPSSVEVCGALSAAESSESPHTLVRSKISRVATEPLQWLSRQSPIFLYGPTAVGKTYLAQCITSAWQTTYQQDVAYYVSATDFRRNLHQAFDEDAFDQLPHRSPELKLVVIDDLHLLPAQSYIQHELTSLIDRVQDRGGGVVLTSNLPPGSLPSLGPSTLDRIMSGLVLSITDHGEEFRRRWLHDLTSRSGVSLSPESVERMVTMIQGDLRRLTGCVQQIAAHTSMHRQEGIHRSKETSGNPTSAGSEATFKESTERSAGYVPTKYVPTGYIPTGHVDVDPQLVEQVIHDALVSRNQVDASEILRVVARHSGITLTEIRSSSRKRVVVQARAMAVYLLRELTEKSYQAIGNLLGRRDHSTIAYSHRTFCKQLESNLTLRQTTSDLTRILLID